MHQLLIFKCIVVYLFEIFVSACRHNTYGQGCLKNCGKCANYTCDYKNGLCLSKQCRDNYRGERCDIRK